MKMRCHLHANKLIFIWMVVHQASIFATQNWVIEVSCVSALLLTAVLPAPLWLRYASGQVRSYCSGKFKAEVSWRRRGYSTLEVHHGCQLAQGSWKYHLLNYLSNFRGRTIIFWGMGWVWVANFYSSPSARESGTTYLLKVIKNLMPKKIYHLLQKK